MIELAVFDIAGTTVHDGDAVNAALRAALAAAGVHADRTQVNAVMGLHKPEALRILLRAHRPEGPTEEEVSLIHEDFLRRMCDYYASSPEVREIAGAAATFAALRRQGVKVALNTGFNRRVANVLLTRLGWKVPAVIDADVTSDEVPRGRPHPDMIQLLMRRLSVHDPRRVAKIGDTRVDIEEGQNAGCGLVIAVTSGAYTREELLPYGPTHIVNSVADVPSLVLPTGSGSRQTSIP